MSHHDVTGHTFEGTSREDLSELANTLISEHHHLEGAYHSVYGLYDILPGVTTLGALRNDWTRDKFAQQIYSPDDVITKEVTVSFPIASFADASRDAVDALVDQWAKKNGKSVTNHRLTNVEGQIRSGITGRAKVVHSVPTGETVTMYEVSNLQGTVLARAHTKTEAKAEMERILLALAKDAWRPTGDLNLAINKVTRRTDGPLGQATVTLVRGKVHLILTIESVKAGAQPAGWFVSMDCHY